MHKNLHHKLKDNNLNLYNEIINHPASVAVHIRRGDIMKVLKWLDNNLEDN